MNIDFTIKYLPPFVEVQENDGKPSYLLRIIRKDGSEIVSTPINFQVSYWKRIFQKNPLPTVGDTTPPALEMSDKRRKGNHELNFSGKIEFKRVSWDAQKGVPLVQEWTREDLENWANQFELASLISSAIDWLIDNNGEPFVYPLSIGEINGLSAVSDISQLGEQNENVEKIKQLTVSHF